MNNQNLKRSMRRFYSSSKLYLEQLKKHDISVYLKYVNKILEHIKKGRKILDVGCGVGQVANFLEDKGYKVNGIDISPLFIKEARKSGNAKFSVMDSTKLKFKDNSFDAVISAETLEHITYPKAALSEMDRVLRKKGVLVLRFPNKQSKLKNL